MEPNGFDVHQADEFLSFQEITLDSEDALAILVERRRAVLHQPV